MHEYRTAFLMYRKNSSNEEKTGLERKKEQQSLTNEITNSNYMHSMCISCELYKFYWL